MTSERPTTSEMDKTATFFRPELLMRSLGITSKKQHPSSHPTSSRMSTQPTASKLNRSQIQQRLSASITQSYEELTPSSKAEQPVEKLDKKGSPTGETKAEDHIEGPKVIIVGVSSKSTKRNRAETKDQSPLSQPNKLLSTSKSQQQLQQQSQRRTPILAFKLNNNRDVDIDQLTSNHSARQVSAINIKTSNITVNDSAYNSVKQSHEGSWSPIRCSDEPSSESAETEFWKKVNSIVQPQTSKQQLTATITPPQGHSLPQTLTRIVSLPAIASPNNISGSNVGTSRLKVLPIYTAQLTGRLSATNDFPSPKWFSSTTQTPQKQDVLSSSSGQSSYSQKAYSNQHQLQQQQQQQRSPINMADNHYIQSSTKPNHHHQQQQQHQSRRSVLGLSTPSSFLSSTEVGVSAGSHTMKSFKRIFPAAASSSEPGMLNETQPSSVLQTSTEVRNLNNQSNVIVAATNQNNLSLLKSAKMQYNLVDPSAALHQQTTTAHRTRSDTSVQLAIPSSLLLKNNSNSTGTRRRSGLDLYFANKSSREKDSKYSSVLKTSQEEEKLVNKLLSKYADNCSSSSCQQQRVNSSTEFDFAKERRRSDDSKQSSAAQKLVVIVKQPTHSINLRKVSRDQTGLVGQQQQQQLDSPLSVQSSSADCEQLLLCNEKIFKFHSPFASSDKQTSIYVKEQEKTSRENEEVSDALDFSFNGDRTQTTQSSSTLVRKQSSSSSTNSSSTFCNNFLQQLQQSARDSQSKVKKLNLRSKQQDNLVRKLFKFDAVNMSSSNHNHLHLVTDE